MATLKRHPMRAALTLDNGHVAEVETLGRGRYTIAWKVLNDPSTVYLQVKEGTDGDYSKEILSHLQGYAHIPILEKIGEVGALALYRTRFYSRLTAKYPAAWSQYRTLAAYQAKAWAALRTPAIGYHRPDVGQVNERFADMVASDETLPASLRDTCEQLVSWCGSYGEYVIEFAPRNLAVDAACGLILLDPCFNYAEMYNARRKKEARW